MPKPTVGQLGWGETLNDFLDTKADAASWQSWDPDWNAGLTLGNGTNSGIYLNFGGLVVGRAQFVLGTTSAVTGPITLVPPTTPLSTFGPSDVQFTDSGSNYYFGDLRYANANFALYARSANGAAVNISATAPFTWAPTDVIDVRFSYRSA